MSWLIRIVDLVYSIAKPRNTVLMTEASKENVLL